MAIITRKLKFNIRTCFFGLSLCSAIIGCSPKVDLQEDKYRETRELMGTIVHIDVCEGIETTEKSKLAYQASWDRLEDIAWRMNVLDSRSDVSKINRSDTEPAQVSADTYDVIHRASYYSRITKGAFDITIWPLIELWKRSEKSGRLPTANEVQRAKNNTGIRYIDMMKGNAIRRANSNTTIDLGGIAKGFAVDEVARIFREHEISDFYIDAGGDLYVGGNNCSGKPWRIGIRDPRDQSKIIDVVEVSNSAVATSGNYERYYTIQGQKFSHVIDPKSGYPQKDVISSTVIAPNAVEADALATALCVLGSQAGSELIDKMTIDHASLIIVKTKTGRIKKFPNKTYASFSAGR